MALPCAICEPTALERLIRSNPQALSQWQALPRRQLPAKAMLLAAGETAPRSWWIESGLVRCYYLAAQGIERNRSFHSHGSWVGASLPPAAPPSPYTIEALEPTQVVELSHATLQSWQQQMPQIQALLNEAMAHLFANQSQREADLLTLAPAERYRAFLAEYSALVERIPIHHAASYLGISHVSLSRIRARMGVANQGRGV